MSDRRFRLSPALLGFVAAAIGIAGASPAVAVPKQSSVEKARASLQAQLDETLAKTKGGKQISANAIEWTDGQGGAVIELFPVPTALANDPQTQDSLKNNHTAVQQVNQHAKLKPALAQGARSTHGASGIQDAVYHPDATKPAIQSGGSATVTPAADGTNYDHGCPSGVFDQWYCFYQNSNFNGVQATGAQGPGNGRMLEWSDWHSSFIDFNSYNFRDQTSSWVNTGSYTINVWNWFTSPNGEVLWTEGSGSRMGYVGDYDNDKADGFWTS